jgi:hypothetical protein
VKTNTLKLLVLLIISSYFGAYAKCEEVKITKINFLIERITKKYQPSAELKQLMKLFKDKYKTDPAWVDEYYAKIKDERNKFQAEQQKAKDELSSMGDDAINYILSRYKQASNSRDIIQKMRLLSYINTPVSQQILKDMALGQGIYSKRKNSSAAQLYIKNLKDKRQAIEFLDCSERNVQSKALQGLRGVAIDAVLFEKISPYLNGNDFGLRMTAADAFGKDPNDEFVNQKVEAIIKSIESTLDLPGANIAVSNMIWVGTKKDNLYVNMISALGIMKGADHVLAEKLKGLKDDTRLCVATAMAYRGNASVKNILWEIINDKNSGVLIRSFAVRALPKIATLEDLPKLITLSKQDDLMVVTLGERNMEMRNGKIINEKPNKDWKLIPELEQDYYPTIEREGIKRYPIRDAAKEAIKAISNKI